MAPFPYKIEVIEAFEERMIKLTPGDWILPYGYLEEMEKLYSMEVRPDDVWLVSHPKTGTTWSCEMVWTLFNGADVEKAKTVPQFTRWCFPEFDAIQKRGWGDIKEKGMTVTEATKQEMKRSFYGETVQKESPRLIKTHLPLALLPPKLLETSKVIYICRNPLDTVVSWYHYALNLSATKADPGFHTFVQLFMENMTPYSPFCQHLTDAWEKRHHPNMFFLTYEDMQQDLPTVLYRTAEFLKKPLNKEQVLKLCQYLHIGSMKNNKMCNWDIYKDHGILKKGGQFMRKGIVGDWKNHLTPEEETQMVQWWQESMKNTGLTFPGVDILNETASKPSIEVPHSRL